MDITLAFVTYNRLAYTKLALASILADRDEQFSLIIWDNASTDGTADYLRCVNDPRIIDVVFSKHNVGQIEAVNAIWQRCHTDLVGKLDNDCIMTPGWTRRLAGAHHDIDNLGVIACWHYFPDDFDYEKAKHKIQTFGNHQIFRHPWTCGTGLLVKRCAYKRMGPIVGPGTTQYWLGMASKGYINGFYYPLIHQEHMDDPKSAHSMLKDEESYQAAKAVTFNINRHGQHTLADRWQWRQKVLDELLQSPWEAKYYTGWRAKLERLRVVPGGSIVAKTIRLRT
jgi:glycosyltransferase involved in cell wall biosynthesis